MKKRPQSNAIAMNNEIGSDDFINTKEYKRFAEFCDSCSLYQYIGLCYGSPGVGKTLSARYYANWDAIESIGVLHKASIEQLEKIPNCHTIFYTPQILNTPGQIKRDINHLRDRVRLILLEKIEGKRSLEPNEMLEGVNVREKLQRTNFAELDWFRGQTNDLLPKMPSRFVRLNNDLSIDIFSIEDPTTLLIIDEADRLKMTGLEQVRDIFDEGGIGVILIGMPGIEKSLSRYPQLYSRVGFVHTFRALSSSEVHELLLLQNWRPKDVELTIDGVADQDTLATIIRITGGNFRLLHRLITQVARIMQINELTTVTTQVIEAARESLVIGST